MDPKRILLIRLDRIGDVMLSTPAFKALKERFPESYSALMVGPHAYDLVKDNPFLDEVIIYDKNKKQKGFLKTLLFAVSLKNKHFDTAIVLHPTLRSHLIAFFAGIKRRIGYKRKGAFLLTDALQHEKEKGEMHEAEYVLQMLRKLGIESLDTTLSIKVPDEVLVKTKELLKSYGVTESDSLITIHPGASCLSKKWPLERFAEIIIHLLKTYNVKIILVSGSDDEAYTKNIFCSIEKNSRIIDLSGTTTLLELASVLKLSRLFISNDSGPVHIAVAVATPVVVIFGRSDKGLSPKRWRPLGKDDIVLHKDVGCKVCLAHNCEKSFLCLKAISAQDVLSSVTHFKERLR